MLITNPVVSRLLAVSKLYLPLSADKMTELIDSVSAVKTYEELPEWIRDYLASVKVAMQKDIQSKSVDENLSIGQGPTAFTDRMQEFGGVKVIKKDEPKK